MKGLASVVLFAGGIAAGIEAVHFGTEPHYSVAAFLSGVLTATSAFTLVCGTIAVRARKKAKAAKPPHK